MEHDKKPLSDPSVRLEAHKTMSRIMVAYTRAMLSGEWAKIEAVQRQIDIIVEAASELQRLGLEIGEHPAYQDMLRALVLQKDQLIVEAMK